jgi:NAD(P)-dependent dehydrogenase (short-subunit alcohol dehydrogenase family)
LLPLLLRGGGRVVNVTSAAGKAGVPMMAPYVAAKHGLEGLSDVLRLELGPLGVHVSVIEPGFIATAMGGKLERDVLDTVEALPEAGRARYGGQLAAMAKSISTHAATGSQPEVVARSVVHALTKQATSDSLPGRRRGEADVVDAPGPVGSAVRPHHPPDGGLSGGG